VHREATRLAAVVDAEQLAESLRPLDDPERMPPACVECGEHCELGWAERTASVGRIETPGDRRDDPRTGTTLNPAHEGSLWAGLAAPASGL
jgi:hypothetical protein